MKKISKISVVLLMVALAVSCFAIFASAEGAAIPADHEAVLEYYEAGYFLNASFNDATDFEVQSSFDEEAFADSSEDFQTSGKVSYQNNSDGTATMRSISPVYFDVITGSSVSFGVNSKFKLDAAETSSFALTLHSEARGALSNNSVKLFEITATAFNVYDGTKSGKPTYVPVEDLVPGTGMLSIEFFLGNDDGAQFVVCNVTPEGGETVSVPFTNSGIAFESFDISFRNITMDYCEIYKGTFIRKLSDNAADIAAEINELAALYASSSNKDEAFKYAEVAAKVLVNYGFYDESVKENADAILAAVAPAYAEAYTGLAEALNAENSYYDAIEIIESSVVYAEFLDALSAADYVVELGKTDEEISNASDAIAAEIVRLEKVKSDTLTAFDAVYSISNVYAADYATLREVADVLIDHPICDTYYDDNHSAEDISAAAKMAIAIVTEFNKKDSAAKKFTESVPIMCDLSNAFSERYAAYIVAKENIFTDDTYDDYTDISVLALYSMYEEAEAALSEVAAYAEEFLWKMSEAALTQSYSVRIIALDAAEPYIDSVERGYPGVQEALDKYYVLRHDVDRKFEIARNYITAVLAVKDAGTVEEKIRGIEVAKAYAALGADVSLVITDMQITVTEANIILSNEEAAISLIQAHVNSYISTVNSIASKTDPAEKRSAINRAIELGADVDTTADGVGAATDILNAAIAAYNAEVAAANSVANECNNIALDIVSRTIPKAHIAQVVAIIKKFFE